MSEFKFSTYTKCINSSKNNYIYGYLISWVNNKLKSKKAVYV